MARGRGGDEVEPVAGGWFRLVLGRGKDREKSREGESGEEKDWIAKERGESMGLGGLLWRPLCPDLRKQPSSEMQERGRLSKSGKKKDEWDRAYFRLTCAPFSSSYFGLHYRHTKESSLPQILLTLHPLQTISRKFRYLTDCL